jgi:aspartate/tyrosine/aromatic aminotransferase
MSNGSLSAKISSAPSDPIFGIVEAFRADPRPEKINLAAGVYMEEDGVTPILASVREAERRLLANSTTKLYKPIGGDPALVKLLRALIFREPGVPFGVLPVIANEGRIEVLHTPGGTGAVRLAVELVRRLRPHAEVWVSDPTWPNHPQIADAVGVPHRSHPWISADARALDLDAVLQSINAAKPGDAFIFHGACHNPTGIDPTAAQWRVIAEAVAAHSLLPILDFAYQGLGDGLVEDAASLRAFLATGCEILVATSASKNFALYDERVGALAIVAEDKEAAAAILTHAKVAIRAAWSNPPGHGGEIVAEILGDDALRAQWEREVTAMRERINGNRRAFVAALASEGAGDFSHLLTGRGMFSLLGLGDAQLKRLRDEQAIYLVSRGRINFAGLSAVKIPVVAKAVAAVID